MVSASKELTGLGVRHALVGGLAVGAHGFARATKDVDFIVDDSAWRQTEGGLLVMTAGLPFRAHGVAIDTLPVGEDERFLTRAIADAESTEGIPVAPVEALVYMKLSSPRAKDRADVIELVKSGIDVAKVAHYLDVNAPALTQAFSEAVQVARSEEDES
ncbi:MAG: hypothetical protein U0166_16170 [Acidobacteriota bacterium]